MSGYVRDDFMSTSKPKRSKKVRIGVCGGGFGCQFQWHLDPDCQVAAVADSRPDRLQRLQETYRCDTAYRSFDELVADKSIEAVAVFTGAPDHVAHAVQAMKNGKHVVSAVPAAQSVDQCGQLLEAVRETGMTYMLAETSYYRSPAITARDFVRKGEFGNIFYTEAEYLHPGIENLWADKDGKRTWRYGRPPMFQGSHCTAYVVCVTGERLVSVSCIGIKGSDPAYSDNIYDNPFCNEFALFRTDRGNAFRVARTWEGAHMHAERAQWFGDKMSFFMESANGLPSVIVRQAGERGADDAGFATSKPVKEEFVQPEWWQTEALPESMRANTGHGGSHTLLTHEFVDSLMRERKPAMDVEVALAMASAACVAHDSAFKDGAQLEIPEFAL